MSKTKRVRKVASNGLVDFCAKCAKRLTKKGVLLTERDLKGATVCDGCDDYLVGAA